MSREESDTLLEFPCQFPLKVFGLNHSDFSQAVVSIVRQHVGAEAPLEINEKLSKNGKYRSMTLVFEATSKTQLDAIYQALTDCEHVTMSL